MPTLRLHLTSGPDQSVTVELFLHRGQLLTHAVKLTTAVSSEEELQEDLRWYLEESLDDTSGAARVRAAQVRGAFRSWGNRLFDALFTANAASHPIWQEVKGDLGNLRIEIEAVGPETSGIPWEILQDPNSKIPLALCVQSFVWSDPNGDNSLKAEKVSETCRLLLVISRPNGQDDVSYRTIASKIFDLLNTKTSFEISVLRPPHFSDLERTLRDAKSAKRPFDVVHFDGHGIHIDAGDSVPIPEGGYILFEEESGEPALPIPGKEFGSLINETGVSAVVLNACRSDYSTKSPQAKVQNNDPVTSFAREMASAGVPVVIAMRYNVYVTSAVRYMEEFYKQLGHGQPLTVAASLARKHLAIDGERWSSSDADVIDDWLVPVVLEYGGDYSVRPNHQQSPKLRQPILIGVTPPPPDIGFVGSDDGLLAVDRSLDQRNVVLLHGFAGGGKTATSSEFCRWYAASNVSIEKVLFTSFEHVPDLEELMALAENLLPQRAEAHERSRVSSRERRQVAIKTLRKVPTLWVWDNVDLVAELPRERSQELLEFLKDAAAAGAKFLLTARAAEHAWLGETATAVRLPPLRQSESAEFARRLIGKLGGNASSATVGPITKFADGNPLTLSVALAAFLNSNGKPSIRAAESFVRKLVEGDIADEDDQADGRSKNLRASLRYGFEAAFSRPELRLLALLYLFRGYSNTWVIVLMGHQPQDPEALGFSDYDFEWTLPKLKAMSPETVEDVLDRAARLGLLSKKATNHYWLHPAIHVQLKSYFELYYSTVTKSAQAARAFAESLGVFSVQFAVVYSQGAREGIIEALSNEEANLVHALDLSRKHGWWQAEIGALHGLFALYSHKGRLPDWNELLRLVTPDFLDHESRPISGRDKYWPFIMDHLWIAANENHDWAEAERLARSVLEWEASRSKDLKSNLPSPLGVRDRMQLKNLAIATSRLADTFRDQGNPNCLELYEEALRIYKSIDDSVNVAIRLFNLGHVFKNVESLRDLSRSAQYYKDAYEAYPEHDKLARSKCIGQLGAVSLELMREAAASGQPESTSTKHLAAAIEHYEASLKLNPSDAILDLAVTHNQLGAAYLNSQADQLKALEHFKKAINYFQLARDPIQTANTQLNAAQLLDMLSRTKEAKEYAREAAEIYENAGYRGEELARAQRMLAEPDS